MDFKNILQSLTSLSEGETKDTKTGRVHKGSYGTEYDGDDTKKEKKPEVKRGRGRPKKDAGEDGEVKKYDTKGLHGVFGGGQKPKKDVGKVSKKHSLKEYIEEVEDSKTQLDEAEQVSEKYMGFEKVKAAAAKGGAKDPGAVAASIGRKKYGKEKFQKAAAAGKKLGEYVQEDDSAIQAFLAKGGKIEQLPYKKPRKADKTDYGSKHIGGFGDKMKASRTGTAAKTQGSKVVGVGEAEQVTIQPAQQNTQVIKQGDKTLGTVTNPQLAQQIKQSIGKGEMSLAGDEVGEGLGDIARKVGGALKTGAKAVGKAIVGKDDDELLRDLQKKAGMRGMAHGKPSMAISDVEKVQEKAPPGAKAERMVKHIKKSYAKDGKLTPKEKSIAYATAWKAHNKGKVEESFDYEGTILTEGALKDLVINLMHDLENGPRGYNINAAVEMNDKGMAQRIVDKTLAHGERYKRLAGTLKSQLRDAALEEFGFVNYDQSLEEANTDPDFDMPISDTVIPEKKPSIFAKAKPVVQKPMGMLSSLKKPDQSLNPFESKDMKDIQLEGWEQQLNSLLTEGITVTSSTGQQGAPDSVSINATDADAQELLAIVRQAGLGVFGGQEQPTSNYGAPMDPHGAEPSGFGTEPEASPEVVGDDGDILALIKKMSGLSTVEPEASEYEDEEETDTSLQPADDGEEDVEDSDEESEENSSDDEEKTTEGNAFSGAVAKAKADGIQKGEKIKVGGKEYPVKEDDVEEGNKFTGNLAKARAAGKEEADLDGDGDMEKVHESEHTCEACGMNESECGCEEQVDENFSNDAGGDAMADTEMAKLKALLAMGNDLHKMKRDQTVGNPTQVSVRESINEWKKLSGIK